MMAELLESISAPSASVSYEPALAILSKTKFDLLITDIFLEGKDGIQLARKARELQPNIEMILITAFPTADTLTQARNLGVSDYIAKPFAFDKLLSLCTKLLQDKREKRRDLHDKYSDFYKIKSPQMSRLQKEVLETALRKSRGNLTRAAERTRISKTSFYRYIKMHKIDLGKFRK